MATVHDIAKLMSVRIEVVYHVIHISREEDEDVNRASREEDHIPPQRSEEEIISPFSTVCTDCTKYSDPA